VLTSLDATLSTRRLSTRRRSRSRSTKAGALLLLLVAMSTAACSSGPTSTGTTTTAPRLFTAPQLTTRILPAPDGYEIDPTPGASGAMTRALFDQFGGVRSPATLGFVAGFKQNYVNTTTDEGLIVTVIEFKTSEGARAYFAETRPTTLSYAGAVLKPFSSIPGAFEANGTKAYDHGYYHAIVDTANNFYFQVVYATPEPSPAPVELGPWANLEYTVLEAS
jgi:hypothetical protein